MVLLRIRGGMWMTPQPVSPRVKETVRGRLQFTMVMAATDGSKSAGKIVKLS